MGSCVQFPSKMLCVEMETLDSQKEMKEWNKHGAVKLPATLNNQETQKT